MNENEVVVFSMMLSRIPLLVVYAVAIGLALRHWRNHRYVAGFVISGFLLHGAVTLLTVYTTWWTMTAAANERSIIEVAKLSTAMQFVAPLLSAGAHALIVIALFYWWQNPPNYVLQGDARNARA